MKRRLTKYAATQLGHPHGVGGRAVAALLNWQNREWMDRAVDLLSPAPGDQVADVGFGGGHALVSLLRRVGPKGRVVGVDPSHDAVRLAQKRYRREIEDGHLVVTESDMAQLESCAFPGLFAGAISVNTAYYIADIEEALVGVRRALRDGGIFVLGVGEPTYMAQLPFAPYLVLRPITEYFDLLNQVGLSVSEHLRTSEDPRAFHLLRCVAGFPAAASDGDARDHD